MRLEVSDFALDPSSRRLTMSVGPGQSVAFVLAEGSDRDRLGRVLTGQERSPFGKIEGMRPETASLRGITRRTKPSSLVQKGAFRASDLAEALGVADAGPELSDAQMAASALMRSISQGPDYLLVDGLLDRLDLWALAGARRLLSQLTLSGTALAVITQRPDVASICDSIVVIRAGRLAFAGSQEELLRRGARHEIEVATENRPGVRALVDPFEVVVRETPEGVLLEASEGQAIAAKLLLAGYGDVKYLIHRAPTIEEALRELG